MTEPDIHNYSSFVQGPQYIPSSEGMSLEGQPTNVDSGLSSIEKSKAVTVAFIAPMDFPMLTSPNQADGDTFFAVVNVANEQGGPVSTYLMEIPIITESEIIQHMLDKWSENLDRLEEEIRRRLNSPQYQIELSLKENPTQAIGGLSIVELQTARSNPPYLLTAIQAAEQTMRSPEPTEQSEQSTDMARLLAIPLISAAFTLGAVGAAEVSIALTGIVSNPFVPVIQMIQSLQTVAPQLLAGILPGVTALIAPLLYFASWEASVSGLNQKEQTHYLTAAQTFARDIVTILNDPNYIKAKLMDRMPEAKQLPPEQRDQLEAFIKTILAGVALSLLYTVEVGKVQKGQYLGMTPEEFKGLLDGTIPVPHPNDPNFAALSTQEQLKATLVLGLKMQLDRLPIEARMQAIEVILESVSDRRSFDSLLSINRVFSEILQGNIYGSNVNLEINQV
jgi:hypothetical protein